MNRVWRGVGIVWQRSNRLSRVWGGFGLVGVSECLLGDSDRVLRGILAVDGSLQLCRDVVGCWVAG